jgi:hypothetical protein
MRDQPSGDRQREDRAKAERERAPSAVSEKTAFFTAGIRAAQLANKTPLTKT